MKYSKQLMLVEMRKVPVLPNNANFQGGPMVAVLAENGYCMALFSSEVEADEYIVKPPAKDSTYSD